MKADIGAYVTRQEAAELLGVHTATVAKWTHSGRLVSETFRGSGDGGRPPTYYLRSHIMEVLAAMEEGDDVCRTRDLAIRALAISSSNERRLIEIYDAMGLGVEPLARDPDSMHELYASTYEVPLIHQLRATQWVRFWASSFFAMETNYLHMASVVTHNPDIWLHYINFADLVERRAQNFIEHDVQRDPALRHAYNYLSAAKKHLVYQGFVYCTQKYSLTVAVAKLGRERDAVNELCALLATPDS
jgi:excisionase family DNA binding protein